MAFIDRERELAALEKLWREKGAQLIVIYGKRRIGKTELIKQFIKDKPHVYFLAQRIRENENLRSLAEAVGGRLGDDLLQRAAFPEWKHFFEYGRERIRSRTILVFDEFPYLAEANKGISSVFQAGWDESLKGAPVVLILCGSRIAMMENETLSHKAPLFGRRTGQIFLKPFAFEEARKFFPGIPFDRCLEFYSLAGGNPSYLNRLDPKRSVGENIVDEVLQPEAFLYNEVEFVLREELREPRNYFAILKAVALGKCRIGEIVNETGLAKGILHKYLFILEDLHVIRKDVPVTEKNPLKSRKGIYGLQDQFFKFWFRYVLTNRGSIEGGKLDGVREKIEADFLGLVAENYERLAVDIVGAHEDRFFPMDRAGRWWDRNEEIDLVALNEGRKEILFGEAKWSLRPVGIDIHENLKRKARLVDWHVSGRTEHFCLFSRSGFTKAMLERARDENVALFHRDKLIEP